MARVPRRRLLPWVYRFFALNWWASSSLFRAYGNHWLPAAAFFVWLSVFNLMAVAIFWAFMTDVWRPSRASACSG